MKSCLVGIAALVLATASLFESSAHAQSVTVQLGWGNITPCSRLEWNNDGFLGTPSATLRTAEQRVYAYATITAPNASSIQNDLQQCAVQGAVAAGLSAIVASPGAAMSAFQAQFEGCMRDRARNYFSLQLHLSEGQCMW